MTTTRQRDRWATRIGLIMAMAGNAIGLGNFLRFPVQATQNGGGAFMIPYLIALVLLALPLLLVEWGMGRFGGARHHGTTPAVFQILWNHPLAKYLGVLGIFLPLTICIYYVYIESWTLAFSFFSASGIYFGVQSQAGMAEFLSGFQGIKDTPYFSGFGHGIGLAYLFFLLTAAVNLAVMYRGISRGIEQMAKIAMPLLFIFAIILVVRVFTLGAPDPAHPEHSVWAGLGFIWNPNLALLKESRVWLAATGQVFFTLSIGFGAVQCYASYLHESDDITLSGVTTAATNEFAEVILGGSIAIPVAFAFFGGAATIAYAKGGAFNLGFQAMPLIFERIPLGAIFGMLWFLLLFFAGITSSVALAQPAITFLHDELNLTHQRAVVIVWLVVILCAQPVIFGLHGGFLDELDFWAGTALLPLFGALEVILFVWVFGRKNRDRKWAWKEIHKGAELQIPIVFYYVMRYITPFYLMALLVAWIWQAGPEVLWMKGAPPEVVTWKWAARGMMLAIIGVLVLLTSIAARRNKPWPRV